MHFKFIEKDGSNLQDIIPFILCSIIKSKFGYHEFFEIIDQYNELMEYLNTESVKIMIDIKKGNENE